MTFADFADSSCGDCADLNATFTLAGPRYEASYTEGTQTRSSVCVWEKCIEICGFDRIVLVLNNTGLVYELVLLLLEQATGAYVEWIHYFAAGAGPLCADWDELEISDALNKDWGTGSEICYHPLFDSLPGTWPIVTATEDQDCEIGCPCDCENCAEGMDNCIDATINGLDNDQCACDCFDLEGIYRLKRTGDCTFVGGLCTAVRTIGYCHYHTLTVTISESGGTWYITATASGDTSATIVWKKSYAEKPDCRNWSAVELTFDSQTGTSYCGASGSTVELDMAPGSQVCDDPCVTVDCASPCDVCDPCETPSAIEITFPVFADGTCSDCADFNSDSPYVMLPDPESTGVDLECCYYSIVFPASWGPCTYTGITAALCAHETSPGEWERQCYVRLETNAYWHGVGWYRKVITWKAVIADADWTDCQTDLGDSSMLGDFVAGWSDTDAYCGFAGTQVTIDGVFP